MPSTTVTSAAGCPPDGFCACPLFSTASATASTFLFSFLSVPFSLTSDTVFLFDLFPIVLKLPNATSEIAPKNNITFFAFFIFSSYFSNF